jgi:hypothetical protein
MCAQTLHTPKLRAIRVTHDLNRVYVIEDGEVCLDIPWQMALDISKNMYKHAKLAEEDDKALSIIQDNALLLRAGFPVGLTDRPDMQKETLHVAKNDRDLRRRLPGGIKSQTIVGTPTVIKHPPKRKKEDA